MSRQNVELEICTGKEDATPVEKVRKLYQSISEELYLCRDDFSVNGESFNSALLFGVLTELNKGKQLLFGEYGGGKTTSAEYMHCLFNNLPLDLIKRVAIRAHPQLTDEKVIGRPHYGKLYGEEEEVVWQHFVLVGPKIVDEFNRMPEPNQSILLNGVDRGDWVYLNDFISTGPQPLFATCNYGDRGNNTLIPPMLDRFDVAVESKFPGVANANEIALDYHNQRDQQLRHPQLTLEAMQILNSGKDYSDIEEELKSIQGQFKSYLAEKGFPVLNEAEKEMAENEIKAIRFNKNAEIYFGFLVSEMNISPRYGQKRSIDEVGTDKGLYLNAAFKGAGSRRGEKSIVRYAQSLAWMQGRKKVNLEHVLRVAPYVLWHRLQWTEDTVNLFKERKRDDPLDLDITKTLLDDGSREFPGVKRRFVESKDNYQRVMNLVTEGSFNEARDLADEYSSGGKGHPMFLDMQKDLVE